MLVAGLHRASTRSLSVSLLDTPRSRSSPCSSGTAHLCPCYSCAVPKPGRNVISTNARQLLAAKHVHDAAGAQGVLDCYQRAWFIRDAANQARAPPLGLLTHH